MFDSTLIDSPRSALITVIAAISLAACGGGDGGEKAPATSNAGATQYEAEGDYAIGSTDAPVTVVEYASVVCSHCATWAKTVYPDFKAKYVDTGKVRYVFRGFPTAPQELADAGHMIAMCAGEENYMKNIKLQFDRQEQIFDMAGKGQAREAYVSLAKASGLSEGGFLECMQNEELRTKYEAVVQGGIDAGVSGTPTFFINGEKAKVFTLEQIEGVILPILGEPVPEKASEEKAE